MVQHPDVLKKAQDEMFKVIGDARLPDFDDRASLPYLECIIREVYRCIFWRIIRQKYYTLTPHTMT